MASTGIYLYFVPLVTLSAPVVGSTLTVDLGSTTGSFVMSFAGATASAGTTMTLSNGGTDSATVYTHTGLTTTSGEPIMAYPGLFGIISYAMLSNTTPGLLGGTRVVANVSFACFAAGTRILTVRGEVLVEELAVGDLVPTLSGRRLSPVTGIGHSRVDCAMVARPWEVLPVRIAAGAFADGMPVRDLVLSPDHCVSVEDGLIPVRCLINNATITQEEVPAITYWQIELDGHDILFADGMPAGSYLDTGTRDSFASGTGSVVTYLRAEDRPLQRACGRGAGAVSACAPLIDDGPVLERVRSLLAERALAIGGPVGRAVFRIEIETAGQRFHVLPAGTICVELASRHHVPPGERRRLGASLASLALDGVPIALDRPILSGGFHEVEQRGSRQTRWTNGLGVLTVPAAEHDQILDITVDLLVRPRLAVAS